MQQEEIKKNDDFTIEKKWFVKLNEGKIEDYYDTSSQIELGKGFFATVYKMKLKNSN